MQSIRARLVLTVTLVMACACAGFGWFAWREADAAHRRDLDQLLRDKASLLAKSLNRENPREVYPMTGEMQRDELGYFGQGFDTNGVLLWKSKELAEPVPLPPPTAWLARQHLSHHFETQAHPTLGALRVVTYPIWEMRHGAPIVFGFVQILKPASVLREQSIGLAGRLAAAGLVTCLLVALATHVLASRWLSGMTGLAEAARQLGQSPSTVQRLPVPRADPEVAALATAFNAMLDRIDRALVHERQFIADASHELRTPLTILRGEIDVVLRRERSAAEYRTILLSNREEIERLSRLAESLLFLARADAGQAAAGLGPVDLVTVVQGTLVRLGPTALAKGVTLRCDAARPDLRVSGDAAAFERVVFNLVENAVRHSPAGESVVVALQQDTEVRLQVIDRGCGIAPEHLPRLFDRFYRVDAARDRLAGGAGLGLAIVKCLVETQGGCVEVASELGVGTTFTVRLPFATAEMKPI